MGLKEIGKRFSTIFRSSNVDTAERSSLPRGGSDPFIESLGAAPIFVIAATQSEGIDARTITQEQLLNATREALERDREDRKKGQALFTYAAGEQQRLPFFTSNDHAVKFIGEYSKERHRVFPFMLLQARGRFLGKIKPESGIVVVMNDKTADERILTQAELSIANRLWPSG